MRRPLNLARQPFRNERLPTLLLALGCAGLLALSARHALAARDLLPERTAGVDGELVALEEEVSRLRAESADLARRSASPGEIAEWAAVRHLVDRRAFSWTALLACLEKTTPPGVRLISIAPGGEEGRLEVALTAVGVTVEDGLDFLRALQLRPEFEGAFLTSVNESNDGIDFAYTMRYVPQASGADSGAQEGEIGASPEETRTGASP